MSEGQVAGRLEVLVDSSLRGFKQKLKRKIEAETKGLAVKVGVELDDKGKFKKAVQAKVDEAAAGVAVKVGIELDNKSAAELKGKVEAAAKAASAKVKAELDTKGIAAEAAAASEEAEAAAPAVKVSMRARVKAFLAEVAAARAEAQALGSKGGGVEIPVKARIRGMRGRTLLRVGLIGGLVSLIEPAVGAIGQLIGGLTAMAGAVGPAFGTLAAAPLAIGSFVQAMMAGKIATQGLGDAMKLLEQQRQARARGEKLSAADQEKLNKATKELTKSQVTFLKRTLALRPAWVQMRKYVAAPLFDVLADQVKPVANTLLPTLQEGLRGTSQVMAGLVSRTAKWLKSPLFSKRAAGGQLFSIMGQNNGTIRAGGRALLDFAKGFAFFYTAAAPFQKRMDGVIESVGRWFLLTSRSNARNGDTAAFLDKAADRLGMLWNITKQLGGGLRGIFKAGDESGMRLFRDFESFLTSWNTWSNSLAGQNRMKQWFDAVEPGFRSIVKIVHDATLAMVAWAEDPKIAGMLEKIRTEFGPALNGLLQGLSDTFGDHVIDLITQLTRAINNAEPAIEILGNLTAALASFLDILNNVAEANPGVTEKVMQIAGALLLLRSGGKLLGKGGALLGMGGKGAKGGGMLAGLLGNGGKAAAAGAGAAAGAEGMGAAAASGGRLAGALGAVAKSPLLKKAGWVGIALGGLEVADSFQRAAWSAKGKDGLADNIAAVRKELEKSTLGKSAKDLGIDLNALATDMAKNGTQGSVYAATMERLAKKYQKAGEIFNDVSPFDAFDDSKVANAQKDLKELGAALDSNKSKTLGAAASANNYMAKGQAAAAAAAKIATAMKGIPKEVITQVQTPGLIRSIESVDVLAQQYDLTPKQIVTTLHAAGVVKTVADVTKAQQMFKLTPKQVVTLIKANGVKPTFSDVARLHRQYKLTPGQVVTLLRATGTDFSMRQALALQKRYHLTPAQVVTLLKAVDNASGTASRVRSIYAGLPREVVTNIVTNHVDKFERTVKRAIGGFVSGPGTATSDSIPARLSNGEFVVKARAVKKYGVGLLNRINTMAFANGGLVQRFRSGGRVKKRRGTPEWASDLIASVRNGVAGPGELNADRLRIRRHSSGGRERAWLKRLDRLYSVGQRAEKVQQRLAAAQARLTKAIEDRSAMQEAIKNSGAEYGSLSNISGSAGGYASPAFLIKTLAKRATDTRTFRTLLSGLRSKGLSKTAYEQILNEGVENGLPLARQLAKASKSQIRQINSYQSSITSTASAIGSDTARAYYNAGINAGRGLVAGLQAQQKSLNKVADGLAKSMVSTIKKALKIKSPSRVLAWVGRFSVDGLTMGVKDRTKHVLQAAGHLSSRLTEALTPDASALRTSATGAQQVATLRASASQAALGVSRTPVVRRSAALVEKLIIQGKTEAETKSALEEAMFRLRLLGNGGVYANRTA